jgi:hypothetical protein
MAMTRRNGKGTPDRKTAAPKAGPAMASQVTADTLQRRQRVEPEPEQAAPTVGKTGGRGGKAERPSEGGTDRLRAKTPLVESTRAHKPPAETPKARGLTGPKAVGRPGK